MPFDRPPAPRHATRAPRPTLRDLADDLTREYRDGLRQGWHAATARDVPTSTPTGIDHFQRIWRAL